MKVLDLDKFVPEKKEIKFGGKIFDITFVPFEITLQVYELIPIMSKIEKNEKIEQEDFQRILDVIYNMLKISDESLEKKWLVRYLTMQRFNELMPFIFTSIFDDGKKKEENEETGQLKFTSDESLTSSVTNTDGATSTS